MIWHIFKKDWNLQWQLALGVALLQVILSVMLWKTGSATPSAATIRLIGLVFVSVFLAQAFLIVESVQSDPLPGVRQDWLVRPIRRRDLLLAKLLFTVLVVQVPVIVTDLIVAIVDGNSFGASLSASLTRSIFSLLVFSLPVFAVASVTKNLLEVLSSVVLSVVVLALFNITINEVPPSRRLSSTALGWEIVALCAIVIVLLATVILTLQYRRRLTAASRWAAVAGVAILLGVSLLPWQPAAFALQRRLSPAPGAAHAVELAFDAYAGPLPPNLPRFGVNAMTDLRIPLSVTGMPADSVLAEEHYDLRLIDSRGVTRASAQSPDYGYAPLLIAREGAGQPTSVSTRLATYMSVAMDTSDYVRLKDQKLDVEIDYSLTLLQLRESYAMPAVNGTARLPGIGACETHVNELGSFIRWGCSQAGQSADCYSLFILNPSTGRSNEEDWHCGNRDYSPFFTQFLGNAESGPSVNDISFHDPKGQFHYAVDSADIAKAEIVIRNYRPLDHFTRHVTVPARTLSDWLEK